jgi:hypothetical protein
VTGTAHDPHEVCEIAAIGGGAAFKINMIEPKISSIRPDELEKHHREENSDE